MIKDKTLIATTLIASLVTIPAFASKEDNERDDYKGRYQEQFEQRHKMQMETMQMMIDTMTILRDINHHPTAAEKQHLSDMIKKMNMMMDKYKEMDGKMMRHMNDDSGNRMMGGPRHDMR